MYINRTIEKKISYLLDNYTKPICILGARQVGKATTVKKCLENYDAVYVNLFDTPQIETVWNETSDISVQTIIYNLEQVLGRSISTDTIIIIDEIQSSPAATASLKSFKEDGRHKVIALGSNFGSFLLSKSRYSFPVGQFHRLRMFPLSFMEFLGAIGEDFTAESLVTSIQNKAINPILHNKCLEYFDLYMRVGAMPEVVKNYIIDNDISKLADLKQSLVDDYLNDFGKFEFAVDNTKALNTIYGAIPRFLSKDNQKFIFTEINYEYKQLVNSFKWLADNNYVIVANQINSISLPLVSNVRESAFKLFSSETSLLMAQAKYNPFTVVNPNDQRYYGFVMENYIATVLTKYHSQVYTYRKGKTEIDFIYENDNTVYAVEVKSGNNKRAKSLQSLKEQNPHIVALKLSRNNFAIGEITDIPLYAFDIILSLDLLNDYYQQ